MSLAPPTGLLSVALRPLGWLYGGAMWCRNRAYDRRVATRLPVPVVSVGNLSAGGTGKTPLVVYLVERALAAGRRPGVLARGYGRAPGASLNDEGMLLAARFEGLLQEQDPDRIAAGRRLVARGADYVIVDDGFQHRRLHRDVDLVCLDAARPFTPVLPAGLQREPSSGLRRASAVVLTRAAGLDAAALAARGEAIARAAGRLLPVFPSEHAPIDLRCYPADQSTPLAALAGRRVALVSAVARPETFVQTVRALGAEVVAHATFPDHHRFTVAEVQRLARDASARDALLLMTEKDHVKLTVDAPAHAVLRIAMRFSTDLPGDLLRLR